MHTNHATASLVLPLNAIRLTFRQKRALSEVSSIVLCRFAGLESITDSCHRFSKPSRGDGSSCEETGTFRINRIVLF